VPTDPTVPPSVPPEQPAASGAAMQEPPPPPAAAFGAMPAPPVVDIYSEAVDPRQVLTPEQIEAYKQHQLTEFSTGMFIFLTIITLGIFGSIYHLLKHGKLPKIKDDDPSAGKAIGFSFIPFFNIYWFFVVWPRLIDRINFQYRLRGRPAPINRQQAITAMILSLVGWFFLLGGVVGYVMLLMVAANIQSAANKLANGEVQ
jgi:hypothetical protein